MITDEQVEAALKAWYDAGDAGNFSSMFAALKAADLASVARIAELEAEIDDAHEVLSMCDIPFHGDDGVEYSLPQRLKTRVKEQRAARAALGEKE